MNLASTIEIYSGGPGSGCNPAVGKCGRPSLGGKVYARPSDIKKYSNWGQEGYEWIGKAGQGEGTIVKGVPITKEELIKKAPVLFHVTTNLPAVKSSGWLLARSTDTEGGLGSHSQASAVSFTVSKDDARNIERELLRVGEISRSGDINLLHKYAVEDEKISGLPEGTLTAKLDASMLQYRENYAAILRNRKDPDFAAKSSTLDAYNLYLWSRDSAGGNKNPILFGDIKSFAKNTPETVGIVAVHSKDVPDEALIRDKVSGDFLHEVQVDADVSVKKAHFLGSR